MERHDVAHTIEAALRVLATPGDVYELRALEVPAGGSYTQTEHGFFDDLTLMAQEAGKLTHRGARAVYWTPNPVDPALLARSANRCQKAKRGAGTQDLDIVRRRWLLVDVDPVRPAGISATEDELSEAQCVAEEIAYTQVDEGWPAPALASSGNGAHLMWRIDWPADDNGLHQRVLKELSERWTTDTVKVDQTVYNPARIWKLYGTWSRKGDQVDGRVHRQAYLISPPGKGLLEHYEVEAWLPAKQPIQAPAKDEWCVTDWMHEQGIDHDEGGPWKRGGRSWRISCPWNGEHGRDAWIAEQPTGEVAAGCHHDSCTWSWSDLRERVDADYRRRQEEERIGAESAKALLEEPEPATEEHPNAWRSKLVEGKTRKDGSPGPVLPIAENIALILLEDPRWHGVIAYDAFQDRLIFTSTPPLRGAIEKGPLTDSTVSVCYGWLQRHWFSRLSKAQLNEAMLMLERRAPQVHPVRDYLASLEWDGRRRVSSWLSEYLGVDDTEYSRAVGQWWLISAVARVMEPGCQAHHVLILEGKQGIGKSTSLQALAGEWFLDTPIDLDSRDAYLAIQGAWIVELAELDTFNRSKSSRAKSFFTSRADKFRRPYGRQVVEMPRQCVFAGTTNDAEYLKDKTGNRRYWPVKCNRINTSRLFEERDQIWAETMELYQAGAKWHPETRAEKAMCDQEQMERVLQDGWLEPIGHWLRKQLPSAGVTTMEVATEALVMPAERVHSGVLRRIASCLREFGYELKFINDNSGKTTRKWFPTDSHALPTDSYTDELPDFH